MTTTPAAATVATATSALNAVYGAIKSSANVAGSTTYPLDFAGLAQLVGVLAPIADVEAGEASFRDYIEGNGDIVQVATS